ncbi:MAG: creatininase family protein [Burkholderiaceae bacterium]|jgi:creatinine amidohydrolase|nr:creatininase family protein [Burkholderiaceae bacterium]
MPSISPAADTAPPPRSRLWSDWSAADFAALDRARAIAVLPLAATEQHGPHLPLSVDSDIAHGIVQAACAHLPVDLPALFLPVQRVGYSPEHTAYPGTLTLKAQTVIGLWTDVAESVAASGIKKLVLLNTHGGNTGLLDVVARDLRARLALLVYSVPNWDRLALADADGRAALNRFTPDEQRFGVHAGQMETAMMLALKPALVRMGQARDFESSAAARVQRFEVLGRGRGAQLAWMAQDLNPAGATGNARAATPEDGRALIEATGQALARLLTEIDQLPADTVRAF